MNDQIIMSKHNAEVAIAVPLFRINNNYELEKIPNFSISLIGEKPIAYAIDTGESITLMSAEFIQDRVEWLGDL